MIIDYLFILNYFFFFFNDSYNACVMYQQQLCYKRQFSYHDGEMDIKGILLLIYYYDRLN